MFSDRHLERRFLIPKSLIIAGASSRIPGTALSLSSPARSTQCVVRFIKEAEVGSVFDDHATKAMGEAFDAACKDLDEAGQPSVADEAVAKRIIEVAKSGERDPNQLRDRALTAFGHKRP
jgi:hypothetical protein